MTRDEFKKLSTIKPKNDPNAWMDEPIKAEKWGNLIFRKDGSFIVGFRKFDNEMDAFAAVAEIENAIKKRKIRRIHQ